MMSKVVSANQTGVLLAGRGGCRLEELLAKNDHLTIEQYELVSRAKRYATEQSLKHIMTKRIPTEQQQQQKTLQRYQALVLMCRVYVGSISFDVNEEMIRQSFAPFGTIKSINLSWDQVTMKHKGFAFVEYDLPEAAQLALEHMNGVQMGQRQIKVGRPSNMPQAAPVIQQIQEECKQNNRIYVSNVHSDLNEQELAELFEPFGKVRVCKLVLTPNSETNQHRGCGFIEFDSESAATEALTMNNFDLGGTILHVCRATTPAENVTINGTLDSESHTNQPAAEEDIQAQLERTNREHNVGESANTSLTSDHHKTSNGYVSQAPGVIVLTNMVSPDEELDDTLQLDVYGECKKHGVVTQVIIYVDKAVKQADSDETRDEIKIFVKYKEEKSAMAAISNLNSRYFGGRQISARLYSRKAFSRRDYTNTD
uniref:Poly(U)-binding-splicing factor half pint n=1 Tax=Aceria tosichella TaxID=561515 RepID=A0A6G1S405_9ACAR